MRAKSPGGGSGDSGGRRQVALAPWTADCADLPCPSFTYWPEDVGEGPLLQPRAGRGPRAWGPVGADLGLFL